MDFDVYRIFFTKKLQIVQPRVWYFIFFLAICSTFASILYNNKSLAIILIDVRFSIDESSTMIDNN